MTELLKLESIASFLINDATLVFDMTRTNKHWLLDYKYFFVKKNISKVTLSEATVFHCHFNDSKYPSVDNDPYLFIESVFEDYIISNWKDKLSIGRIEILAWSKFTVEKDTGLFYLYDEKNNYKGIYCNCMNRGDECIYVGQTLSDFFDLEATAKEITSTNPNEDFFVIKKKLSQSQLMTYDKLLKPEQFKVLDSELGFQINLALYERLILNTFIPLSDNDLKLSKLELISEEDDLVFLWYVETNTFKIKVENKSDYIDLGIYKTMNKILKFLGIEKQFVLFRNFDFGQEYGVAYLDSKMKDKLNSLIRIDLIEV